MALTSKNAARPHLQQRSADGQDAARVAAVLDRYAGVALAVVEAVLTAKYVNAVVGVDATAGQTWPWRGPPYSRRPIGPQ